MMPEPNEPGIFTLADCPVLGQLGPSTEWKELLPCSVCGRTGRRQAIFLEYEFDGWEGQDLVTSDQHYVVTTRLRDALLVADLHGLEFRDMRAIRSDLFADLAPDPEIELPEFHHLLIEERYKSPSGWWELIDRCKVCGEAIWDYTERVGEGLMAAISSRIGPPREAFRDAWAGSDIFFLDDPGPPLVTRAVVDVFEKVEVEGVAFHPARWG